jgi:hypothetical protein
MARPRLLQSVKDTNAKLNAYWREVKGIEGDKENLPQTPTITGLALHLGYHDLQSFKHSLENLPSDIEPLIKRAVTQIERYYEQALTTRPQCTGAIFWLKNRGWKDIQEVKVNDDQQKAITDAQRQAAREFAEQMLLRKLPVGGDIVGGKAQTPIVANPEKRNIGPSDISTEFTSDNNDVTKSHNDIPDPAGKWAMDDDDNSNVTMSSGDKGIDAFGALDPANGGKWAMDDDDTAAVTT